MLWLYGCPHQHHKNIIRVLPRLCNGELDDVVDKITNQVPSFSFVTFTKATELPDVDAAASADRGTVRGTAAPYQAPVKHKGAARANNGSTTRRFAMTLLKWWLV